MFRILIVDDFAPFRALARWHCQHLGLSVAEAAGGPEGLAGLSDGSFQLAMVDVHMEPMDGYSFARAVRTRKELDELKIIMITADARAPAADDPRPPRIDGYLLKPLDRAAFKLLLTSWGMYRDDAHFPGFAPREEGTEEGG